LREAPRQGDETRLDPLTIHYVGNVVNMCTVLWVHQLCDGTWFDRSQNLHVTYPNLHQS
jgi:hypothetical protein